LKGELFGIEGELFGIWKENYLVLRENYLVLDFLPYIWWNSEKISTIEGDIVIWRR